MEGQGKESDGETNFIVDICDEVSGYVRPFSLWFWQWEMISSWQESGNFGLITGCAQGDKVQENVWPPVFTLQKLMSCEVA